MKSIVQNKRATYDYHIEQEFLCGMVLEGWEVKSICNGKANISGSYVSIKDGELFLIGSHFTTEVRDNSVDKRHTTRSRKLLMKKSEINKLIGKVQRSGYTLVPLEIVSGKYFKLKIGLAKGKNNADKRESIKERDWKRDQERLVKSR